jgi:hypothetical protein
MKLFALAILAVLPSGAYSNAEGSNATVIPSAITIGAPLNDQCSNAISLNPLSDRIMGDSTNTTYDPSNYFNICRNSIYDQGLWYSIENMSNDTLSVSVSLYSEFDILISVYQGDDCQNLKCVAGFQYEKLKNIVFLASPATKYFFFVYGNINFYFGKFKLTVDGTPSFLSLIDSQTDTIIEPLGASMDYRTLPTPRLNIQANFGSDITVRSVRMTFNNPKRNFCEKKAPYSVFGDFKGDFFNATIPMGKHLVTATPYAQSGCQGPAGISLAKNFTIGPGCLYYFYAYDTSNIWYQDETTCDLGYGNSGSNVNVSALPCNVNIEYQPYCGFRIQSVRMTLRNAVTNKVVHDVTDRESPFFLFDTQTVIVTEDGIVFAASNSSIAPGSYILTPFIDGIRHPDLKLFIGNETACNACGTESCECPGISVTNG